MPRRCQRHLDLVDGLVTVVSNVALGEGPDACRALLTAGGPLALADAGDGVLEDVGGEAGMDDGCVGDGAGHGQGAGALGGHGDGNACAERGRSRPAYVGAVSAKFGSLTSQHVPYALDVVVQFREARRAQSQVQHGAVAAAQAEERTALGQLVDGGDGGSGDRRVAGQRVAHRRAQHDPLGGGCHDAEGNVQLAGQRLRISHAHVVEPHLLGQPGASRDILQVVREHSNAEFHCG